MLRTIKSIFIYIFGMSNGILLGGCALVIYDRYCTVKERRKQPTAKAYNAYYPRYDCYDSYDKERHAKEMVIKYNRFSTSEAVDKILNELKKDCNNYGSVSIGYFLELVPGTMFIKIERYLYDYGWKSLDNVTYGISYEGSIGVYKIEFPEFEKLN